MTSQLSDEAIQLVIEESETTTNSLVTAIVGGKRGFEESCNVLSLRVAQRLVGGSISYTDADHVMNWVWSYISGWLVRNKRSEVPEPALSIFEAIEQGEYHHARGARGADPVELYTLPSLRKTLAVNQLTDRRSETE